MRVGGAGLTKPQLQKAAEKILMCEWPRISESRKRHFIMRIHSTLTALLLVLFAIHAIGAAEDKPNAVTGKKTSAGDQSQTLFARPRVETHARRSVVTNGDVEVPLVVVRGTPYEMGRQLGEAMAKEIQAFVPKALAGISANWGPRRSSCARRPGSIGGVCG